MRDDLPIASSPLVHSRIAVIRDEAVRHVERYYTANLGLPMPLAALARQFGKRARQAGYPLTEVLLDDPRLFMQMTVKGGYLVVPRAQYIEAYAAEEDTVQEKFWKAHGVMEPTCLDLRGARAAAASVKAE